MHAEPASSRRESLGATAPGGSARLPDSLVQAILLGLQHIATTRDGQKLLLANSIESVLADFFLGHGFSQGARSNPAAFSLRLSNPRSFPPFLRIFAVELHPQHHQPALSCPHAQHVQVAVVVAPAHRCKASSRPPDCILLRSKPVHSYSLADTGRVA